MRLDINRLSSYSKSKLIKLAISRKLIGKNRARRLNENELKDRIINKLDKSVMMIQKTFRGYIARRNLMDIKSCQLPPKYYNNETILGDSVKDIPNEYIYTYEGYVYDIREIKNMYKNPYTNIQFPDIIKMQIDRIINNLRKKNINTEIDNNIPISSELTVITTSLFNRLTELESYPNMELFIKYSYVKLYYYFKYINMFSIIEDVVYIGDQMELSKLYRECSYLHDEIDLTDSETETTINDSIIIDKKKNLVCYIQKYKYFLIHILLSILQINDIHTKTRALIISECIRPDIIFAYNNREYRNQYLSD